MHNMNNDNILTICRTLKQTPNATSPEIDEFIKKFPKLYEYVTTETIYDEELLQNLLKHRINIDNDFVETNMAAAEHIADKYLYNDTNLKRPSEMEMDKHREKLRRTNKWKK